MSTTEDRSRFAVKNLSVLAYANGFTLWHYRAGKATRKDVGADEFFADARDMLAIGDMIMVSASDGCTIRAVGGTDVTTELK